MITIKLYIKSKRFEVKGNNFKKSYKLTGYQEIAKALSLIYDRNGIQLNNPEDVARTVFSGDSPSSRIVEGLQFDKIRNGFLIKRN